MKTRLTYFFTMVLAMVLSLSFSACSDDDETMVDESSIIGLWYESSDSSVSFEFRNDGTGVLSTQAGTQNFEYTYTPADRTLQLWFIDSSVVNIFSVQRTGNTLMLTQGNSTYVLKKG